MDIQQRDFKWLEENFFTTEETANLLGISKQALTSLVRRKKIRCAKKGKMLLFHRFEIEERLKIQEGLRNKYRPYEGSTYKAESNV